MEFNKEKARGVIGRLVERYKELSATGETNKYSEETTKQSFILPLFKALGWDVENPKEVNAEEQVAHGYRVDYVFRINGIPKMFVEAKRVGADLEDPKFAQQVINYAWIKGATWAVLTNFEEIRIYNSEWKGMDPQIGLYKIIHWNDFINYLDNLWLLSRESFEKGVLDQKAEEVGKKVKKSPVGKKILEDLVHWRETLSKNIVKENKDRGISGNELDETVQRIIDRLIFMRTCEDRGIEINALLAAKNNTLTNPKFKLWTTIKDLFRVYDREYDSKLFQPHLCDEVGIEDDVIYEVICGLYQNAEYQIKYDFSAIDADVLGSIYEQYLSHILKKTEKRAKVEEEFTHRKEQGIYYTPTYIVDYIVKNTLGELFKNKKPEEVEKMRVLDPACGSGSFLIRAFDVLDEYYKEKEPQNDTLIRKTKILENNIFGVDLDTKAVEIAQLNLLLKLAEKRHRLPSLQNNIKCGNSLIDDEKITGDKAFKWEKEFKQIIDGGGFDVVIGNPPYIRPENVPSIERGYYLNSQKYNKFFGRFDVYILFIEKALKLLKPNGYFSFIIPYSFLNQNYSKLLRKWILNEFRIVSILDLSQVKVFETAEISTCILTIQKSKQQKNNPTKIVKPVSLQNLNQPGATLLSQEIFLTTPQFMIRTDLNENKLSLIHKISEGTLPISEIFYTVIGSVPHDTKTGASKDRLLSDKKEGDAFKPYLEGKDISRYKLAWRGIYLNYQPKLMHRPKFPELFENEKLIIRNISTKEGLLGMYDNKHFYTNDTVSLCVPWFKLKNLNIKGEDISKEVLENSEKYNLLYCLGLINSKVLNFFFKLLLSSNLHVYPEAVRNLPIKKNLEFQQQPITKLVQKMLLLNQRLNEIGDKKTDERARIEEEIKKTDAEIDELVYKIYEITEEEKRIIEESLK